MPSRARRRSLLAEVFVALVALTVLTTGCSSSDGGDGGGGTEPPPTDPGVVEDDGLADVGGRLVYGLDGETEGWNPSTSVWGVAGRQVGRALFDTLTAYDADLVPRPDLAESVTPNADFTEWTIVVRPGIVLHDGEPVTAEVVRANLEIMAAAPLTSAQLGPVATVTTVGERELVVRMSGPWVTFPHALTTQAGIVADPDWLRSGSSEGAIGTGAFTFGEWAPDDHLLVRRFDRYWRFDPAGTRLPYLDEVEFRPQPDSDARAASLVAGNLDVMQAVSSSQTERLTELADEGRLQLFDGGTTTETAETFVQLNAMAEPFDDLDARLALALATDASAYVTAIEDGRYDVARGPFSPDSPWFAETTYPDPDADAAAGTAVAVRAAHGGAFATTLLVRADHHSLAGAQLLQDQWTEAGIDVVLEPVDQVELTARVALGDYQAVLLRQFDAPHPSVDAPAWHPANARAVGEVAANSARNRDDAIGAALDAAAASTDDSTVQTRYAEVQQRLADDLPYVWLFHERVTIVAAERVVNVVHHLLPDGERGLDLQAGSHTLWQVRLRA